MVEADPFLLLDHVGPQINAPNEAKGAPWHPHRGFETVSYILDGEIAHHDTNGGGGVIAELDATGARRWFQFWEPASSPQP
jgi:redox-sensitive bicupin YhaK (pirin superfamily)